MSGLDQARENLHTMDMQIAKLEYETRERIVRCTGLDGDADLVSREEWGKFNEQVRPLREQREHLAKAIATIVGMAAPPPMFIKGAITDAYESGWRPDGFGGAPLRRDR